MPQMGSRTFAIFGGRWRVSGHELGNLGRRESSRVCCIPPALSTCIMLQLLGNKWY